MNYCNFHALILRQKSLTLCICKIVTAQLAATLNLSNFSSTSQSYENKIIQMIAPLLGKSWFTSIHKVYLDRDLIPPPNNVIIFGVLSLPPSLI